MTAIYEQSVVHVVGFSILSYLLRKNVETSLLFNICNFGPPSRATDAIPPNLVGL